VDRSRERKKESLPGVKGKQLFEPWSGGLNLDYQKSKKERFPSESRREGGSRRSTNRGVGRVTVGGLRGGAFQQQRREEKRWSLNWRTAEKAS